jgi:hypothetical protein
LSHINVFIFEYYRHKLFHANQVVGIHLDCQHLLFLLLERTRTWVMENCFFLNMLFLFVYQQEAVPEKLHLPQSDNLQILFCRKICLKQSVNVSFLHFRKQTNKELLIGHWQLVVGLLGKGQNGNVNCLTNLHERLDG